MKINKFYFINLSYYNPNEMSGTHVGLHIPPITETDGGPLQFNLKYIKMKKLNHMLRKYLKTNIYFKVCTNNAFCEKLQHC